MEKKTKPPRWVVDPETGCWIWTRCIHPHSGYGEVFVDYETTPAHRYVYEQRRGPIPEGKHLVRRPTCPRNCVNPDHMEVMTQAQSLCRIHNLQRNRASEQASAAKQRAIASIS